MNTGRSVFTGLLLVAISGGSVWAGTLPEPMPPGIGIRLTLEGPIFVNAKGMSLYWQGPSCDDSHKTVVRPIQPEGAVNFFVEEARLRSCLQKNPPLLATAGAKPTGKWTITARANGMKQWAYDGRPLYTSIKDKSAGDFNGSYPTRLGRGQSHAAVAPLSGLPAGVRWRVTAWGLALSDGTGKVLYYQAAAGAPRCAGDCIRTWKPLAVPAIAHPGNLSKDWTISKRADGLEQWAFKGHALYTYAYDSPANGEQVFGDTYGGTWAAPIKNWQVALLKPEPGHPREVTVQTLSGDTELYSFGLPKVVYADAGGMTLYTMHCSEGAGNEDDGGAVACDDVGDDPRYWLAFCGGEKLCSATWRPLRASAGDKPLDHIWTIVSINPQNPFQPVLKGQAIRVWAYRGRPVFTYSHDKLPGDYYGDDNGFGTTGIGQMQARPIPAYAHAPIPPPVMQLPVASQKARLSGGPKPGVRRGAAG